MLGLELERGIREAWLRLRGKILSDAQELQRRLARRRMKSLTRPPRAWCIAIRASDRRITPAHWVISPEHAMDLDHPHHPYEPIEHEVTIQTHAIRRYCHPIRIAAPAEQVTVVAKSLGGHRSTLHRARKQGRYYEHYYKGLGGKHGPPIPVIYTRELLDPGSSNFFAAPHPLWQSFWEFLSRFIPDDFEQTVIRKPVFGRLNPQNDRQLRGFVWLCPGCKKEVRTIYFPAAVPTLFDTWFTDPVIQLKLSDADLPDSPPPTFACANCHGVIHLSTIADGCWNNFISRLTRGLLYGHEVPKPASFIPSRKRTRIRLLNCSAPMQRKVLTRLSNGWSNQQIARDLGISIQAVRCHTYKLRRQENVPNLQALAKKLSFAVSPPLTMAQRATLRRSQIQQLIVQGLTNQRIAQVLNVSVGSVQSDTHAIYKVHGFNGQQSKARHALANKMGAALPLTRAQKLCLKAAELRDQGLKWTQIAAQLNLPLTTVHSYGHLIR